MSTPGFLRGARYRRAAGSSRKGNAMVNKESAATTLNHLKMIGKTAGGDNSHKQGEWEKSRAAIVACIQTGQSVAATGEPHLIEDIKGSVNAHLNAIEATAHLE